MGIQTPSLARVKSFKLPHIQPPIQVVISNEILLFHDPLFVLGIFFQHLSCKGIPFYSTPLSAVLRLCLGRCDLATAVARYPDSQQKLQKLVCALCMALMKMTMICLMHFVIFSSKLIFVHICYLHVIFY